MTEDFDVFNLKPNILKGIYGYGFERPSEIQFKAVPEMTARHDLLAQAQSGTGKTGAFSIGMLEIVDETKDFTQGIILSPTRELAEQTFDVITSLAKYTSTRVHLSVGGHSVQEERAQLSESRPHVVVGTPGRVLQMVEENLMRIDELSLLVMDEADEILKIGFRDQIINIFSRIPKNSQVAVFSATMSREAIETTKKFLVAPVNILVKPEQLTLKYIKQFYVYINHENYKLDTLLDIYGKLCVSQAIIFVNSKRKVNILNENLKSNGFSVGCMHSEMSMKERNEVYMKFRKGTVRIVVSTDVMARGIDIQGISFVINYDIPKSRDTYLHRIGRSGRYGRKGVAINFVTDDDVKDMRYIEKFYNTVIEEMPEDISEYLL